jgi:hypothetical protein
MITLYLLKNDEQSEHVCELFRDLAVSHRVVYKPSLPSRLRLPAVVDDDRILQGREEIEAYVEELTLYLAEWQKFQSDACYCNRDGEVD